MKWINLILTEKTKNRIQCFQEYMNVGQWHLKFIFSEEKKKFTFILFCFFGFLTKHFKFLFFAFFLLRIKWFFKHQCLCVCMMAIYHFFFVFSFVDKIFSITNHPPPPRSLSNILLFFFCWKNWCQIKFKYQDEKKRVTVVDF